MKNAYIIVNRLAWIVILLGSIVSSILAIILLLSAIFNFKPFITSQTSGWDFGFTEHAYGIPVPVKMKLMIPDSSMISEKFVVGPGESATTSRNIVKLLPPDTKWDSIYRKNDAVYRNTVDASYYSDTIVTSYFVRMLEKNEKIPFEVKGSILKTGIIIIDTEEAGLRLLLLLPSICTLLFFAFAAWQAAFLLKDIEKNNFFQNQNFLRFQKMGWALIIYEAVLYILEKLPPGYSYISMWFKSTTAHYRTPFGELVFSPSQFYTADIEWVFAGYILIMIGLALKKENERRMGGEARSTAPLPVQD